MFIFALMVIGTFVLIAAQSYLSAIKPPARSRPMLKTRYVPRAVKR